MDFLKQVKRQSKIILKVAKVEFCYKEFKFVRKEIIDGNCPFDLKKFIPEKCRNCRFYGEKIIDSKEEK